MTISGSGFTGATAVKFGTTAATNVVVVSPVTITATSPAETAATVDVTVTGSGSTSTTSSADQFTYMAAPAVTGVTATSGPLAGGATVTITGTGFTGATAVNFGTVAATNVVVVSATQITATSPAEAAGTVDVKVTGPGGTSATVTADHYTYVAAPTVTGVSPTAGPLAGGTTVTITGTNLSGATAVDFGVTPGTNVIATSATQITAVSPAETAGYADVTVVTVGGTSATSLADEFTYVAPPSRDGPQRRGRAVGGRHVGDYHRQQLHRRDGGQLRRTAATTFTVNSATQITATSPAEAAGAVNVTVTTVGGTTATSSADPVHLHGSAHGDGHHSHLGRLGGRHEGDDHGHELHAGDGRGLRHGRGDQLHTHLVDADHGRQSGGIGRNGERDGDQPWRHVGDFHGRPFQLRGGAGGDLGHSHGRACGGRHGGDHQRHGIHRRDGGRLRHDWRQPA